jgi:hypothetical protein
MFLVKKVWKIQETFGFQIKFNQFLNFLAKFHHIFYTNFLLKKTIESSHLHQKTLFQMNID